MNERRSVRVLFVLALVAVATVYLTALRTLPPSVFWSPDEGARFLQMIGWSTKPEPGYTLPYAGKAMDPEFRFYPKPAHTQYPRPLEGGGVSFSYPPWFSLASIPLYKVVGARGLYIIPLLSGLGCALLAGVLAGRIRSGAGMPAVIGAGLATPVMFYSLVFWEHTLAACLCLTGLVVLLGVPGKPAGRACRLGLFATALLAASVAIRFEMLILLASLPAAGILLAAVGPARSDPRIPWRERGAGACLAAGIAVAAVVAAWFLLSTPGTGPAGALFPSVRSHDLLPRDFIVKAGWRLRDARMWLQLPRHVCGLLVDEAAMGGPALSWQAGCAAVAGVAIAFLSQFQRGSARLTVWCAGAALAGCASLLALSCTARFRSVHSVFLPAPFLTIAFLPVADEGRSRPRAFVGIFCGVYFCMYAAATLIAEARTGGAEWGARYLLPLYPLLAVLAAVRFDLFMGGAGYARGRKAVIAALGAVLLLLACQFSVRGVIELQIAKRDLAAVEQEIRRRPEPAVTDLWWLPAALAATFPEKAIYTVSGADELRLLVSRLSGRTDRLVYLTYGLFRADRLDLKPFMLELEEQGNVRGMAFTVYRIRATPRGAPAAVVRPKSSGQSGGKRST